VQNTRKGEGKEKKQKREHYKTRIRKKETRKKINTLRKKVHKNVEV